MRTPGFHSESSLTPTVGLYRGHAVFGASAIGTVIAQRAGCSDCLLYTEPGAGGRTIGVRICCTTICKWGFGCVQSCWAENCWTPPNGDIYV
jgi:hypothetical protein